MSPNKMNTIWTTGSAVNRAVEWEWHAETWVSAKNYHINVSTDSCCFVGLLCSRHRAAKNHIYKENRKWKRMRKLKMPNDIRHTQTLQDILASCYTLTRLHCKYIIAGWWSVSYDNNRNFSLEEVHNGIALKQFICFSRRFMSINRAKRSFHSTWCIRNMTRALLFSRMATYCPFTSQRGSGAVKCLWLNET